MITGPVPHILTMVILVHQVLIHAPRHLLIISNMNSKYNGYIGILISKDKHGMWSQNHMPYSNQ